MSKIISLCAALEARMDTVLFAQNPEEEDHTVRNAAGATAAAGAVGTGGYLADRAIMKRYNTGSMSYSPGGRLITTERPGRLGAYRAGLDDLGAAASRVSSNAIASGRESASRLGNAALTQGRNAATAASAKLRSVGSKLSKEARAVIAKLRGR